jgi:hypothetical protein
MCVFATQDTTIAHGPTEVLFPHSLDLLQEAMESLDDSDLPSGDSTGSDPVPGGDEDPNPMQEHVFRSEKSKLLYLRKPR